MVARLIAVMLRFALLSESVLVRTRVDVAMLHWHSLHGDV